MGLLAVGDVCAVNGGRVWVIGRYPATDIPYPPKI